MLPVSVNHIVLPPDTAVQLLQQHIPQLKRFILPPRKPLHRQFHRFGKTCCARKTLRSGPSAALLESSVLSGMQRCTAPYV